MGYSAKILRIDDSGERCVIVVSDNGMPHDQMSRYLLGKCSSLATKTVLNLGKNICQLYRWGDEMGLDVEDRIRSGQSLGITEIDSLVYYLSLNQRQMCKQQKMKAVGSDVIAFAGYVSASTLEQKIDAITDYLTYLGNIAVEGRLITDPYYVAIGPAIKDLNQQLNARKVKGKSRPRVGLTETEQQFLLSVIHPAHPENPFEQRTRVRNQLIFKLLLLCGIRLGELLALNVSSCNLMGDTPSIRFGQNLTKEKDPRTLPPEVKTLPRTIYLTPELARDVDSYIMNERKARGREARKAAPYVFLNTLKKPAAMTEGAVYHMCYLLREKFSDQLAKLHPHRLRHTFNDNLMLTYADSLDEEEFKKLQRWLNGWTDESEEGKTYTQRARELMGQRCLQTIHANIMSGVYKSEKTVTSNVHYDNDVDM